MSLLMEALKQQHQTTADAPEQVKVSASEPLPVAASQQHWQFVAIALLVVLGLALGFGLVLWFNSQKAPASAEPVTEPVPPVVVTAAASSGLPPATPGLILSELLSVPVEEDFPAQDQLVISAERAAREGQSLDEQVDELTGFAAERPMQEADPAAPVQDLTRVSPELRADQVPQELRDKFERAMQAAGDGGRKSQVHEHAPPARDISTLDDVLQRQIAPIRFQAHVYSTDPAQRWVKVNGKDLQEGQWITADIQLKEITPQYVLMQTGRQLFSMEALSEWSYRLKP